MCRFILAWCDEKAFGLRHTENCCSVVILSFGITKSFINMSSLCWIGLNSIFVGIINDTESIQMLTSDMHSIRPFMPYLLRTQHCVLQPVLHAEILVQRKLWRKVKNQQKAGRMVHFCSINQHSANLLLLYIHPSAAARRAALWKYMLPASSLLAVTEKDTHCITAYKHNTNCQVW